MNEKTVPSTRFDGFTNARKQRKPSHNVPAVRFKADDGSEFPAWEDRQFLELIDRIIDYRGKTPKKIGLEWTPEPTKYLALSALNVKQGYIDFAVDPHYGDKALYDKWMTGNELYPGEVVITTEAPMGNVAQIPDSKPYILSQRVIAFIPQGDLVSDDYLACLLRSPQVQNQLRNLATGGTAQGISQRSLTRVKVTIPSLPEQKKIAACLSSADETIALCQRKLGLLTQAKKALVQQIFSQKVRFTADDGSEFPAWEEKKIGDIATFFNGRAFSQEELQNKGKYKVLRVGNLFSNANYYYSDLELEENKYITNGDLIYAWSATFGPQIYEGEKCIYHYHIWKVEPSLTKVSRDYLYFLLQHDVSGLESMLNGGTMLHITKQTMESRLCIVPSLPEQKKIASCLSSADALIDQARAELEQWQEVKKSLLQQLFV